MKKTKKPNKINAVIQEAAETYEQIENNRKRVEGKDYKELLKRIVESIENHNKLDILAYDALVKEYPQVKNILNNLIIELRTFSIYDEEPLTVNFDYSAYLKQIEELAEIK